MSAYRDGGAIYTDGETTIRRSDIFNNDRGGHGGAIAVAGGATDVRRNSFVDNSAFVGGVAAADEQTPQPIHRLRAASLAG